MPQKDNTVLASKVRYRRAMLAEVEEPVVYEAHGGRGVVWSYCYRGMPGVVTETSPAKTAILAKQRPTWAVYECPAEVALSAGFIGLFGVNVVDLDPYGSPWPCIEALMAGQMPDRLALIVHDRMGQKLSLKGAWQVGALAAAVERHGNEWVCANYLAVCEEILAEKAAQAGYDLGRFVGEYCGKMRQQTNYAAVLTKASS